MKKQILFICAALFALLMPATQALSQQSAQLYVDNVSGTPNAYMVMVKPANANVANYLRTWAMTYPALVSVAPANPQGQVQITLDPSARFQDVVSGMSNMLSAQMGTPLVYASGGAGESVSAHVLNVNDIPAMAQDPNESKEDWMLRVAKHLESIRGNENFSNVEFNGQAGTLSLLVNHPQISEEAAIRGISDILKF